MARTSETLQSILLREMNRAQVKNPAYSIRAFARRLGMQPAAVSELIRGKRTASRELAARILTQLTLDPAEQQAVLARLPSRRRKGRSPSTGDILAYTELELDEYRLIADWYHFAILSLSETQHYRHEPAWIARRLGIPVSAAQAALLRLKKLGILTRDPHGGLKRKAANLSSSDGLINHSLRKAHAQNLELAQRSLELDPIEIRDFSAVTMAIHPADLPKARVRLREFRDRLCAELEAGAKHEVYKLCLQLIPLTRVVPEERKYP